MLDQTQINQTSNLVELGKSNSEFTQTQVHPPKLNLEPTRTSPKSPKIKHIQPEMGQTSTQIWSNQTSNSSETRFINQNPTTNPPEPSKHPELRTHELCSTQQYSKIVHKRTSTKVVVSKEGQIISCTNISTSNSINFDFDSPSFD